MIKNDKATRVLLLVSVGSSGGVLLNSIGKEWWRIAMALTGMLLFAGMAYYFHKERQRKEGA